MEESMTQSSWRTKFLIGGAIAGAVLGVLTAFLLTRAADESHGGPPEVSTTDALKAGLGVLGVVRAIAALGDGK